MNAKRGLRVLVVEDNPGDEAMLRRMLRKSEVAHFDVESTDSVVIAQEKLSDEEFDLCILDHNLPDGTSGDILEFARARELSTPILVVTSHADLQLSMEVIHSGAADFLAKKHINSEGFEHFLANNIARAEHVNQLKQSATQDHLTNLYSRRYLEGHIERILASRNRSPQVSSLIFIDLDGFKPVNDRLSHREGDKALVSVAELIRGSVRDVDVPCRWGGDEFVIAAYNSDETSVRIVGERIVAAISGMELPNDLRLGASIGIAGLQDDIKDVETWAYRASMAMKKAKQAGGNQIVLASEIT